MYQNNRSNSYVKFGKLYIKPTLTADKYGDDMLTNGNSIHLGGGAPADKLVARMRMHSGATWRHDLTGFPYHFLF